MLTIRATKQDLDKAIRTVSMATQSSAAADDLASHYLFRVKDAAVEILAASRKFVARAPLPAEVQGTGTFSVEAKRIGAMLPNTDGVITFEYDKAVVTVRTHPGKLEFHSLDPKTFPFWDDVFSTSTEIGVFDTAPFTKGLSYLKGFTAPPTADTKHPAYTVIAPVDGKLAAINPTVAVAAIVQIPDYPTAGGYRIHVGSVQPLLKFLQQGSKAMVRKHDKVTFYVLEDGSHFGEGLFQVVFPEKYVLNLEVDKEQEGTDTVTWILPKEDLIRGLRFLSSAMDTSALVRFVHQDLDVAVYGKGTTGKELKITVPLISEESESDVPFLSKEGFSLKVENLMQVLDAWEGDRITFNLSFRESGAKGFVSFSEIRDGVRYTTYVACR